MIDFKQMTDDEQTAMAACEEWSNGEPAVTTQEEALVLGILNEALDRGGIRADQRHHAVYCHHVAKANVDKFHLLSP